MSKTNSSITIPVIPVPNKRPPSLRQLRSVPPPPPRKPIPPKMTLLKTNSNSNSTRFMFNYKKNQLQLPDHCTNISKSYQTLPPSPRSLSLSPSSHLSNSIHSRSSTHSNTLKYQYQYTSPKTHTFISSPRDETKLQCHIEQLYTTNSLTPTPGSSLENINTPSWINLGLNSNNNIMKNVKVRSTISLMDDLSSLSFGNLQGINEKGKRRHRRSSTNSLRSSTASIRSMSSSSSSSASSSHLRRIVRKKTKKKKRRSSVSLGLSKSPSSQSLRLFNDKDRNNMRIDCVCGRAMDLTSNPKKKYPPSSMLTCQQNEKCKKKLTVGKDLFYSCCKKLKYHDTSNGRCILCYSCATSYHPKQERMKKNYDLLIRGIKNNEIGIIKCSKDTKKYILSLSTNSNTEIVRKLREFHIDGRIKKNSTNKHNMHKSKSMRIINKHTNNNNNNNNNFIIVNKQKIRVIKEGYMEKRGNFWTAFKRRYFKLLENKQLFYYTDKACSNNKGVERGIANLMNTLHVKKQDKEGSGLNIITPSREWQFLCNTNKERDEWEIILRKLLL